MWIWTPGTTGLNGCSCWERVFLFWLLYNNIVDLLSDRFALLSIAFWNPLVYFLLFVILPLPIALILGSKAGKWLCRHFEYVP